MKKILYIITLLAAGHWSFGQVPSVAPAQEKPVALMNGVAHLGDGKIIENAIITFDKGKITMVADARNAKVDLAGYEVVNIEGKHVYPGFILPSTDLGLVEVDAVAATDDKRERGSMNVSVRSIIAYNTDSELIPTMRFNGILTAQITPKGGLVSGNSSIVQLDAWNWEDAALKIDDGLHMNWPSKTLGPRWWMGETKRRDNPNYALSVQALSELMDNARAYGKETNRVKNLKLESALEVLNGNKQLYIHSNSAKSIIDAINFANAHGIKKKVLVGAREAYLIADFVKENNVPVLLSDVHSLPAKTEDDIDLPYKMAKILSDKGILVGLTYNGTHNSRNLPFYAGTTVAYGMDKEAALQLITANTAKILGVDDQLGMLKQGMSATLFVSEGDALDMRGNNVTVAYIQGRSIALEAMQQRLFKKYSDKYGHE